MNFRYLLVPILLFPFLVQAQGGAQTRFPQPGERLILRETTTLYSLPGYDYKRYQASQDTFDTLREYGITDIIPRKVAWPTKGEAVYFLDKIDVRVNNKDEVSFRVRYDSLNGERVGYANASLFQLEAPKAPAPRAGSFDSGPSAPQARSSDSKHSMPQAGASDPRPSLPQARSSDSRSFIPEVPRPTAEKGCLNCSQYNISTICQLTTFKDLSRDIQNFSSNFKSKDELADYFYQSRKGCKDTYHDKYLEEYQHYIRDAAKAFQVPEVLLSCLLFKENQFDQATSQAGAIGMAQFMPGTITHIDNIMREIDVNKNDKDLKEYQDRYLSAVQENVALKEAGKPLKQIPTQWRKDYEYVTNKLNSRALASDWQGYINNLKKDRVFKKFYKKNPWDGDYPTRFNSTRAKIPPLAIGASALYLKDMLNYFQQDLDDDLLAGEGQVLPFMVAVAGAYNMGPGNASRNIKTPPPAPKDANKWIKRMKTNSETASHMESIKRCMEKNNKNPPTAIGQGGRLVEQNLCTK